MRVINEILYYSESELGKDTDFESLEKKKLPKKKYTLVRKMEDFVHTKQYTVYKNGQPTTVTQKFITQPFLKNREEKRKDKNALKKKSHTLEFHHNQVRKRRELKKLNKRRNVS